MQYSSPVIKSKRRIIDKAYEFETHLALSKAIDRLCRIDEVDEERYSRGSWIAVDVDTVRNRGICEFELKMMTSTGFFGIAMAGTRITGKIHATEENSTKGSFEIYMTLSEWIASVGGLLALVGGLIAYIWYAEPTRGKAQFWIFVVLLLIIVGIAAIYAERRKMLNSIFKALELSGKP